MSKEAKARIRINDNGIGVTYVYFLQGVNTKGWNIGITPAIGKEDGAGYGRTLTPCINTVSFRLWEESMTKQIFVNLPIKNLNKSIDFFTKLGFTFNPQFTDETASCMIVAENIFVMLFNPHASRPRVALGMDLPEPLPVDVGIDLGGGDVCMAEHHLDRAQVCPPLEEVGGKGVP